MTDRYKVIISNKNIYKEAELLPDPGKLCIGTGKNCDVRLHADMFFEPVEAVFTYNDAVWSVSVSSNLYMTKNNDDIRKLQSVTLVHGDSLKVRYRKSDGFVFDLEFDADFEQGAHSYNRCGDCMGIGILTIGSSQNCHIIPGGQYASRDSINLIRRGNGFEVEIRYSEYGVIINGRKAASGDIIRNGDFFSVADNYFYYKNDRIWTDKAGRARFNGLPVLDSIERGTYPEFKRNSRIKAVVNEDKIPVLDPEKKPEKPKNNLLLRLLPSVGMLLAAGVMAATGGSMMIIFSLVSVTVAAITAVLTLKQNNKEYNERVASRRENYARYIAGKRAEIEQCRNEERQTLEEIYIPLEQEQSNIHIFSPDLFDREKKDDDFLCVRLGTGSLRSRREIDYKKQESIEPEDDLQQIPGMLCEEYRYINSVPVVCDLKLVNALGITGPEEYRYELFKNMVIDLAARHFHTDVSMVFVSEKRNRNTLRWMRFLPNLYNEQLGVRNIVSDDESKALLFEYLYKELTFREQNKGYENRIIVFLYDEYGFRSHPVSKFVENARDLGVTFIFFGNTRADIPAGCDSVIMLDNPQTGYLINAEDKNDTVGFSYPLMSQHQAERIVQLLAPVYTEEISLEGSLTKSISLFDILNIIAASDLDLGERWAESNITKSMAAPLGVAKTGMIRLDLHDTAHGPHGLVAGTTGSGKSELLQTYILAMSTLYHPYEAGFVIIDFKGGGMVNQFKDLPHLMGAITNIDGKEIDRSLKSIKAELQKRQRLFAEADVNHIDRYIQLYKQGKAKIPLPHLIIIVDEFAELKAEQPEFMKELISAARIGRSLGVHLILATQKPAGQVNEQIWSNSRFKLCLKVQSREDSNEVIKSPLAAEIKEPGRAYLQVGNNEIFELFQSAYSGAPEKTDDSSVKEFSVIELTDSGKRVPVYVRKKQKDTANRTQLDAIVDHVSGYCASNGISKLPDICLPSLKEVISFPDKSGLLPADAAITTEIGIYDDPDNQYQGIFSLPIAEQNTMIIGSSRSGKTNVLQTVIKSIALKYTPQEVSMYILDFASMVLKNFEELKHVGGVVISSEDEKLKNLFKMLFASIEKRKEKMLAAGVSSFAAYREAGHKDLPQIILFIDNLTALREMYFQDDDELIRLCREGLSAGISVIAANSQTSGIGYRYLSNFAGRIALFCNDSNEYGALFDHCRISLDDIRGRAIIDKDKVNLECQTFLAFDGEKEIERVNAIKAFVKERNAELEGPAARRIPEIPEVLSAEALLADHASVMNREYVLIAGMDYSVVEPVTIDLASCGIITLSGRPGMGQKNFIKYLIGTCEKLYPGKSEVHIVDGLEKRLKEFSDLSNVVSYDSLSMKAPELVKDTCQALNDRYDALISGKEEALSTEPLKILIFNDMEALKAIGADTEAAAAYENITGRLKAMKICIINASFENAQVSYSAPAPVRKAKDNSILFFFNDISDLKIKDIPMQYLRQYKKPVVPGDCYMMKDSSFIKLKTPLV